VALWEEDVSGYWKVVSTSRAMCGIYVAADNMFPEASCAKEIVRTSHR